MKDRLFKASVVERQQDILVISVRRDCYVERVWDSRRAA